MIKIKNTFVKEVKAQVSSYNMENNLDKTMQFDLNINKEDLTKSILNDVYTALKKGYNDVNKPIGRISDFRGPFLHY